MKLKVDENLPAAATALLRSAGHDVSSVVDEGLVGAPDDAVLSAAAREDRVLLTLDRGLGDLRANPPGSHPGIVVFRLRNQDAGTVRDSIDRLVEQVDLRDLAGCNVIVEEARLRVRREGPPAGA